MTEEYYSEIQNTWEKLEADLKKVGLREGINEGRDSNFQKFFDKGFEQGFKNGYKLGKIQGVSSTSLKILPHNNIKNTSENQKASTGLCLICSEKIEDKAISKIVHEQTELLNKTLEKMC